MYRLPIRQEQVRQLSSARSGSTCAKATSTRENLQDQTINAILLYFRQNGPS